MSASAPHRSAVRRRMLPAARRGRHALRQAHRMRRPGRESGNGVTAYASSLSWATEQGGAAALTHAAAGAAHRDGTTERLAALIELARERDDEPDLDYPELVVLLESEARRERLRRRRRQA